MTNEMTGEAVSAHKVRRRLWRRNQTSTTRITADQAV
jgi:hypothetical protein